MPGAAANRRDDVMEPGLGEAGAGASDRYRVFAHLQAEKGALYRRLLEVFTAEKERFAIALRPAEVWTQLAQSADTESVIPTGDEVEAALRQLTAWGNLEDSLDTAEVATVEDFYHPRYLYQLSAEGEAAEHALAHFHERLRKPGELQTTALHEILEFLDSLGTCLADEPLDDAKVHLVLRNLSERFAQLTSRAQSFMRGIQRTTELHEMELDKFLEYKERLIDYLDRFIGELVLCTNRIAHSIRELEKRGLSEAFAGAARRELADSLNLTPELLTEAEENWSRRWQGLRGWFIGANGPSQAERLRARARGAIPALLAAVSNLNDRRTRRTDRAADFLALASHFAQASSDAAAHQLWRAAFGLAPCRHLRINLETIERRERTPESARTSWLHAEPLWVSPRLRHTGRITIRGSSRGVVDHSRQRAELERLAWEETQQIERARAQLETGRPLRLNEIRCLDPHAFQLFLELLGEALARKSHPEAPVEITSAEGALYIRLDPTPDGRHASLRTEIGEFHGRDHWITIERSIAAPR